MQLVETLVLLRKNGVVEGGQLKLEIPRFLFVLAYFNAHFGLFLIILIHLESQLEIFPLVEKHCCKEVFCSLCVC